MLSDWPGAVFKFSDLALAAFDAPQTRLAEYGNVAIQPARRQKSFASANAGAFDYGVPTPMMVAVAADVVMAVFSA
jgi:hypothetical protein